MAQWCCWGRRSMRRSPTRTWTGGGRTSECCHCLNHRPADHDCSVSLYTSHRVPTFPSPLCLHGHMCFFFHSRGVKTQGWPWSQQPDGQCPSWKSVDHFVQILNDWGCFGRLVTEKPLAIFKFSEQATTLESPSFHLCEKKKKTVLMFSKGRKPASSFWNKRDKHISQQAQPVNAFRVHTSVFLYKNTHFPLQRK